MHYPAISELTGSDGCYLKLIFLKAEQPPVNGLGFIVKAQSIGVQGTLDEVWFEKESLLLFIEQSEYLALSSDAQASIESLSPEECIIEISRHKKNRNEVIYIVHVKMNRVNYILDAVYENRIEVYFDTDRQSLIHFTSLVKEVLQDYTELDM